MCGIAGAFDLQGRRRFSLYRLRAMGEAIEHRGPDESGSHVDRGVGFHSRRLSIIDIAEGRQPIANEDGKVLAVFNGEIFNYRELRAELRAKGHSFRTQSDTEVLVHLWEDFGPGLVDHLEGQFALAIFDKNQGTVFLARDPFGICPLFIHQTSDGWLLFCSEIKGLVASGLVGPALDTRGVDHIFTFFAMGTRRTMFKDVESLPPGHSLLLAPKGHKKEHQFYDVDFPAMGRERQGSPATLAQELGERLKRAVDLRLRADVPVVSYLSGGVDSSLVAKLAGSILEERGKQLETFTIRIKDPKLDETERALLTARMIGSTPTTIGCGSEEISGSYPDLVVAAETPVIDTSSAAIYRLASTVRRAGYKVALTGEGADEALAGYPWHKASRLLRLLDRIGLSTRWRRRFLLKASQHKLNWEFFQERYRRLGGYHAMSDLYTFCGVSGIQLYHPELLEELHKSGRDATADLELPLDRMAEWHPLNRSLYLGYKIMLSGLLMTHKGDRPALANSVEARFPFLDRSVVDFCASLSPDLKLKGWKQDKFILREYAKTLLDHSVALRPKNIFRASYSGSFTDPMPKYVEQLLSEESLKKTGLFRTEAVTNIRNYLSKRHWRIGPHMLREVGLVGVVSTQLWHHLFLNSDLCELPAWEPPELEFRANS